MSIELTGTDNYPSAEHHDAITDEQKKCDEKFYGGSSHCIITLKWQFNLTGFAEMEINTEFARKFSGFGILKYDWGLTEQVAS